MVITTYLNKIVQDDIGKFEGGVFSLLQISQKKHLESILSKNEMVYYEKLFRNKRRQNEMCFGRLAAKELISEMIDYRGSLNSIELRKQEEGGKPKLYIDNERIALDVSIAHNDAYAVAACSGNGMVGIDIEKYNVEVTQSFLKYAYSKEEIAYYNRCRTSHKNMWMLLWTIKEAIGKAFHTGLSLGIHFVKIYLDEKTGKLHLVFCEEERICKILSQKNISLYYLENDENYITICYIGEKKE